MTTVSKKLCVIGDGCCGIFDLIWYLANGSPIGKCVPGIYLTFLATVQVDSTLVHLSLHHCPGQEDYDRLRQLYYPGTDVLLVCFSVDSPESLENAELRHFSEVQHYCPGVPVILVATRIECRDDQYTCKLLAKTNQKPLTTSDGRAVADRLGVYAYLECSENSGQGINELLTTAAQAALSHVPKVQRRRRRCIML